MLIQQLGDNPQYRFPSSVKHRLLGLRTRYCTNDQHAHPVQGFNCLARGHLLCGFLRFLNTSGNNTTVDYAVRPIK
jgi:hypothetical protein